MNSRIAFIVVFCPTVLVACAPMHWVRAGVPPEQARTDMTECRQLAWQEAIRWHPAGPAWPYPLGFRGSVFSPYRSPLDDPFFHESRLAAFCMESKGYRLEAADKPAQAR